VSENGKTPEQELAWEAKRRTRAVVAAAIAGVTTLAGQLYIQAGVLGDIPRVGLVQAIEPALQGVPAARVDPRSATIVFLDDKAPQLIVASLVLAVGTLLIGYVLWYLFRATQARRPELPNAFGYLAIGGPVVLGLVSVVRQVISAIQASDFVSGTDRSSDAVDAVVNDGGYVAAGFIGSAAQLALAFAFVIVALNAMRVGLLTRFMGVLGIIVGVLFVIPLGPLPVVQAFWLIALAALFAQRWPSGQPPAWASGKA